MSKAIEKFLNSISNSDDRKLSEGLLAEKLIPAIKEEFSGNNMTGELTVDITPNSVEWLRFVDAVDRVISESLRKAEAYNGLEKFFRWLNRNYGCQILIEEICPHGKVFEHKIERHMDMLKYLQGDSKTIKDLEKHYFINERNLRTYLNELENGIDFLGQKIKIDVDRSRTRVGKQQLSYSSTVHPVFLPLNLTEVFALTVGIKKISIGTQYEAVLNNLSDWIYSQLTPYAKDILDESIDKWDEDICFGKGSTGYRTEQQIFQDNSLIEYNYLEKTGEAKTVIYKVDESRNSIRGRIRLKDSNTVEVVSDDQRSIIIDKKDIIKIE